jgi:hypothetical protein
MFIAPAITNQSKLRRSETKAATHIALLRSYELPKQQCRKRVIAGCASGTPRTKTRAVPDHH